MNMVEGSNSPLLESSLVEQADRFGLSSSFIKELPDFAKKLMNRLDKLGNATYKDNKISMLDETLMSAALIEHNPDLINAVFDCKDQEELCGIQRDLIRGSLLSDLGKVASPELIWMYHGINFDLQTVKTKLPNFLNKYPKIDKNIGLMQLPYSVAMDFYKEIAYNGSDDMSARDKLDTSSTHGRKDDMTMTESENPVTGWQKSRLACDKKLKELGFKVNSQGGAEYVDDECTWHDVMSGAHLAVLPDILKSCGIDNDPDWERAIFVAKNHHMSRGLVNGLPLIPKDRKFLEQIWTNYDVDQNQWTKMALMEEVFDMSLASVFRAPRYGDNHGINSRTRIMQNLRRSEQEGRIDRVERAYIILSMRGLGDGNILADAVVDYVKNIGK